MNLNDLKKISTLALKTIVPIVGIGTTSPQVRLHVNGNTRVGGPDLSLGNDDGRAQGVILEQRALVHSDTTVPGTPYDDMLNLNWAGDFEGGTRIQGPRVIVDGNVGIGITNPGYKLDVQGGDINASGSVRAAGVALTSDVRYKRDVEPLDNALEKILNIRGVSYNWRTEEFPQKHFNDRHQVGVIAQEVEQQFPEVVDTNNDGYKSVNYPALVAPLIEAVKTLYNRILVVEDLQATQGREIASVRAQKADKAETEALRAEKDKEIAELKAKNKELELRLEQIERSLKSR